VSIGDAVISDNSTRSHKVWKIFKYLITNRHKRVTVETLIDVLWPDEGPDNPQKSLYTLMSRLRKLLNAGEDGAQYILFQHDCYHFNHDLPVWLDVSHFESLIKQAEGDSDEQKKISLFEQAVDIYTGHYMAESASEMWILPVTNYYRRLYMRMVTQLADIYARLGMQDEVIRLCGKAIENEPFEESLHEHLIHALFINGDVEMAKKQYKGFSDSVKKEFGAEPSESFRASCKGILSVGNRQQNLAAIKRKLELESGRSGAFFCGADIFNQIYTFDKRSDERMKFPVFLALMTISVGAGKSDEEKAIKSAMLIMRQCIMRTLRSGDIVSQYSKNQYLLMLSARITDDAKTAMTRVKREFEEAYQGVACSTQIHFSQIGNASGQGKSKNS